MMHSFDICHFNSTSLMDTYWETEHNKKKKTQVEISGKIDFLNICITNLVHLLRNPRCFQQV